MLLFSFTILISHREEFFGKKKVKIKNFHFFEILRKKIFEGKIFRVKKKIQLSGKRNEKLKK